MYTPDTHFFLPTPFLAKKAGLLQLFKIDAIIVATAHHGRTAAENRRLESIDFRHLCAKKRYSLLLAQLGKKNPAKRTRSQESPGKERKNPCPQAPRRHAARTAVITTTCGSRSIQAAVTRKRVKNLNLRVHADGTVTMSIPMRTSIARAQDFLDRKAPWIARRL